MKLARLILTVLLLEPLAIGVTTAHAADIVANNIAPSQTLTFGDINLTKPPKRVERGSSLPAGRIEAV